MGHLTSAPPLSCSCDFGVTSFTRHTCRERGSHLFEHKAGQHGGVRQARQLLDRRPRSGEARISGVQGSGRGRGPAGGGLGRRRGRCCSGGSAIGGLPRRGGGRVGAGRGVALGQRRRQEGGGSEARSECSEAPAEATTTSRYAKGG